MAVESTVKKTRKLVYAASGDPNGLLITETIMLLSVLGGVGSLPFLELRGLHWYWIVTLAAGLLTILAGIWYALRHMQQTNDAKSWLPWLIKSVESLLQIIGHLFTWRAGDVSPTGKPGPLLVLPRFAVLTGILILLPALASRWMQQQQIQNAYLFEVYFCTPAFLVLIAGTGYYAFPILNVKPKHGPQIAGLLKSGLQALSALLLWIYLGLSVGLSGIDWMFWSALALTVVGTGLGIPASMAENDSLPALPAGDESSTMSPEGQG